MALIKSPVGDMVLDMKEVDIRDHMLIVTGQMGLWASTVEVGEKEAWEVFKMMFKLKVIVYFLGLPLKALFKTLKDVKQEESKITI